MKRLMLVLVIAVWSIGIASAQSFVFGFQTGISLGSQKWNGFQRSLLLRPNFDAFIESWNADNKVSVMAKLGYHIRGSSIKQRGWYDPGSMESYSGTTAAMEFHNAVLTLAFKQKFPFGVDNRAYYVLGTRGEYTMSTDFAGYLDYLEGTENKFVFGMSFGAGAEFMFSRRVAGMIEFSVNPDFSKQIYIPPQNTGFNDPVSGLPITIPEQDISNLSFEITVGMRFLREVIYID